MILENDLERKAWQFVYTYAMERADRGCNDLPKELVEAFKGTTMKSLDLDTNEEIDVPITMDFMLIEWLKEQIK